MKKNYKDIFWGIILVALGVVLVLAKLGVMPWLEAIPVGRLIATIILLAISITGITDRNVFVTLIPISLIACLFDEELHITAITPWVLIIATVLVCIGITKIFPNKNVKVVYDGHSYGTFNGPSDGNEGTTFDSNVSISNTFGETTKKLLSGELDTKSASTLLLALITAIEYMSEQLFEHHMALIDDFKKVVATYKEAFKDTEGNVRIKAAYAVNRACDMKVLLAEKYDSYVEELVK